ncbi:hypothetical protein CRG98_037801 [Punica granatum]|uniref:Uncharacterized protein n=1 Tax=Punica granatum TaxID=22663 RepID=A0A2I0ICU5_PUNGR|nr:hypothetical protein CRG98_037801 [Punica granatum]
MPNRHVFFFFFFFFPNQIAAASQMKLFREHGVSEKNFALFLFCQPRHVRTPPDRFKDIVARAKEMGISPSQYGWSEEMTLRAFVKYPWCMLVSGSKIMAIMDYYIKEMGLEGSFIA